MLRLPTHTSSAGCLGHPRGIATAYQSSCRVVTALGRQEGEPLVVDLRSVLIEDRAQLWDVLAAPCGLPRWFGRNLDAWWDTIQTGAISDVLDDHPVLIIRVRSQGLFALGADGERFIRTTNECDYATAEVFD